MRGKWDKRDDRGGTPQPGLYALRLVPGGPLVPARILHHADTGLWQADIDDTLSPPVIDPLACEHITRIWHGAQRSTTDEHEFLAATKAWATRHMPTHPLLHPRRRVDVTALPPPIP